jgi:hypothetical protein
MLAILFTRTKESDQFSGLVPPFGRRGLFILQYANDTVVFMDHNLEHSHNVKLLLTALEQMLGLQLTSIKVNFSVMDWLRNVKTIIHVFLVVLLV